MIGNRRGPSVPADGWGCALCMEITNQASWWTQTKTSSTATAVAAAETWFALRNSITRGSTRKPWRGCANGAALNPCCRKRHVSIAFSYTARRGGCLSAPTRNPFTGADRAHADRLRARRLPAGLANATGSLFAGPASGRPGDRRGLRRLRASDRLSVGRQPLWPQPFAGGAASPLFAGLQGRLVRMEASPIPSGSDSGRGPVRLRRAVGGPLSQRHLLARNPSQRAPVSAAL